MSIFLKLFKEIKEVRICQSSFDEAKLSQHQRQRKPAEGDHVALDLDGDRNRKHPCMYKYHGRN